MRRAFFLCSRTLRLSSSVKSNLNPLSNNKFDYIPKFPLVPLPSSSFLFYSSENDSSIEKPDVSIDNKLDKPDLRSETDLSDTDEAAIMNVEDVDNKVLKSKLEEYLHKQKEDGLPEIFQDILSRKFLGFHEETDDELLEDLQLEPIDDVKDEEFESDFEDVHETDHEIDDLYESNDLVQKRLASDHFFNMDEKKWDEMINEATEKGFLADMRECEGILDDMKNWNKLLPDEIKKKVEAKFEEISDRVEKGELEVEEGYELFKEFEDTMVKECIDIMEAEGPPQLDGNDSKKDLDDPPGEGPILRWQTRVVLAPGGESWHPKNRKVKMSVTVKELGLSKHQFRRFREIAGKRYHSGRDELTIVSERFEHREENRKDCLRTLFNLIEEAAKANKLVEDALTSHLKDKLKSNPHFMKRLNAKKTGILASKAGNFLPGIPSSSPSSMNSSARPYSTTSIYMNRSFPRSNSSIFLSSGTVLRSEVSPLTGGMFSVDTGLGAPKISMRDELTGVPTDHSITRFENKVGTLDRVAGSETLIREHMLKRFFVDLVAGESLIKERATARFNDLVGTTDAVAGEPIVILPRILRQKLVWMELNKKWRKKRVVKGLPFKRVKGGFSIYIAGFVAFLPLRYRQLRGRSSEEFVIENIKGKLGRGQGGRCRITVQSR